MGGCQNTIVQLWAFPRLCGVPQLISKSQKSVVFETLHELLITATMSPLAARRGTPPLPPKSRRWLESEDIKGMREPLLHDTSCQSHGERPWTLPGVHAPNFGRHLDTARLSEPHI